MYEPSSTLRTPQNLLQPLWRYISVDYLCDILETGELYFQNLHAFDDKREGALTTRSREHLANWFQHQNKSSRQRAYEEVDRYQENQRAFYVNCWHMNNYESYLMWKAYADRGFAIQTTLELVQASFEPFTGVIHGGIVDYVDFERDLTPVGNVFNHVATKDMPYRDEREFRLVVWDNDPKNKNIVKAGKGIRVPVNVRMLIHSIVVNPFSAAISPKLERLLEDHGLSVGSSNVASRTRVQ